MRTTLFIVTFTLFCLGAVRGENAATNQGAALPIIIPEPQTLRLVGPERIVLGEAGRPRFEIVAAAKGDFFDEARQLVETEIRGGSKRGSRQPTTTIILTTATNHLDALTLTSAESTALAHGDQAYVIRMQAGNPSKVWIIGASPLGTYYGAATFVQLVTTAISGTVTVPQVEVQDYPDIPGRMSANWVLQWDWEINGYDWGDGLEAFLARCKRQIDLCARYKVNQIRFLGGRISPGPDYMKDRYEKIRRFALELNRYARRKGVSLQYASSSFGVDHYGWGQPYPEPWILNRDRYPDGKVYSCLGGTNGSCLGNEDLIGRIAERQKQFVRDTEPSIIYLHNIDLATYKQLAAVWKKRCRECRARFQDDEPYGAHGLAAAAANLYNRLTAELRTVKNSASGYDAARDLNIVFASPGYTFWIETDASWEKDLKYFAEIGRQVKDKRNVQLTFREQFNRISGGLRTSEMARALEQTGWTNGMFMFAVQGADFLDSPNMFVSSPVLTSAFRGAGTLYNFNGHVFSELQVLANVNYAWNRNASGSVDPEQFLGTALREEAARYSTAQRHSDHLYGPWLDTACANLYGKKAAPMMANLFRLERDQGPIMPLAAWIDYHWKDAAYDWRGQAGRNLRAKQLVDQAVAVCDPEAKADLVRLGKCLEVVSRICGFCDAVHREKLEASKIKARARELLDWLDTNFKFEVTEPDGGDPGLWKNVIIRLRDSQAILPAK